MCDDPTLSVSAAGRGWIRKSMGVYDGQHGRCVYWPPWVLTIRRLHSCDCLCFVLCRSCLTKPSEISAINFVTTADTNRRQSSRCNKPALFFKWARWSREITKDDKFSVEQKHLVLKIPDTEWWFWSFTNEMSRRGKKQISETERLAFHQSTFPLSNVKELKKKTLLIAGTISDWNTT